MTAERPLPRIFFDASCLMAAVGSPGGGSSAVIAQCADGILAGFTSESVAAEVRRNVAKKLCPSAMTRLELLIHTPPLLFVVPAEDAVALYVGINTKDAHVYAGAVAAQANYLLTLDLPLIAEVAAMGGSILALTPYRFIREIVPSLGR